MSPIISNVHFIVATRTLHNFISFFIPYTNYLHIFNTEEVHRYTRNFNYRSVKQISGGTFFAIGTSAMLITI